MDCLDCKYHRKHPIKARREKQMGLRIGCVKPVKEWMIPTDIMSNYPLYFEPGSIEQPCPNYEGKDNEILVAVNHPANRDITKP